MKKCTRFEPQEDCNLPCDEEIYKKCVGRLLGGVLKIILQELGFVVKVNHQQSNGADIQVYLGERIVFVLEVINWNITCRLYNKRRDCIIGNLSEFDCHRLFVYTNNLSQKQLTKIKEENIYLLQIGYQILRQPCYDFYDEKGYTIGRTIFSNSIKAEIRSKILEFLDNEYYSIKNLRYLFA